MATQPITPQAVTVRLRKIHLDGDLSLPPHPKGVVLFAHGSGSSRFSKRNRAVAAGLNQRDQATLLIDLLTSQEEKMDAWTGELRFNIALLADRLVGTIHWMKELPELRALPIGLFGASTGGGAALVAAATEPQAVAAIVSRGGRPDLAGEDLPRVRAPTLLIVGGEDYPVIEMNQQAMRQMQGEVELEIIPGATHLFEEPGALEQVAQLAGDFFDRHF